jgi:hypothetical protein
MAITYRAIIGGGGGEELEFNALEIIEDKSEVLNFGTLTTLPSSKKDNFQIFERIKIINTDALGNPILYDEMVIISDKVIKVSKTQELYTHTITFLENITKFEKILATNLAFTQPLSGTRVSKIDVLNKIRDLVPLERLSLHADTRLFTLNFDLALMTEDAPQYFFRGLSLREILNEVASYDSGIAVLGDGNVLNFTFFYELLSAIGIEEDILDRMVSADSKLYGTTIQVNMENGVSSDDANIAKVVFPSEKAWATLRATQVKLSDTSFQIRLPFKIETETFAWMQYRTDDFVLRTLNVDAQILTKPEWDRLPVEASVLGDKYENNYKANTFYYELGGRTISNNGLFGFWDGTNAIEGFIKRALVLNGLDTSDYNGFDLDNVAFRIAFVPYYNATMRSQKQNINDVLYNLQIPTNQAGRIVSADRLVQNMQGKIERYGQDEISIKKRGTIFTELFSLGDFTTYENSLYIVSTRRIEYYRSHYTVTYGLSKNFNRVSNRVVIDQENREFEQLLTRQTVDRDLVYEEYIEMDIKPLTNDSLITPFGMEGYINAFRSPREFFGNERGDPDTGNNQDCDVAFIKSDQMDDPAITSGKGIYRQLTKGGAGNAIHFHWEFDDTVKAGDQSETDTYLKADDIAVEIETNKTVTYTDVNGELDTLEFSFHKGWVGEDFNYKKEFPVDDIPDNPMFGGHGRGSLEADDSLKVLKDAGEKLSGTYIIHTVPHWQHAHRFVIGSQFIKHNNLIHILSPTEDLYVYRSNTETYHGITNNTKALGTRIDACDYGLFLNGSTYGTYQYSIEVDEDFTDGYKSWGIGNANGDLYLGVNQDDGLDINRVYFNPRNKRANLKYKFD